MNNAYTTPPGALHNYSWAFAGGEQLGLIAASKGRGVEAGCRMFMAAALEPSCRMFMAEALEPSCRMFMAEALEPSCRMHVYGRGIGAELPQVGRGIGAELPQVGRPVVRVSPPG